MTEEFKVLKVINSQILTNGDYLNGLYVCLYHFVFINVAVTVLQFVNWFNLSNDLSL